MSFRTVASAVRDATELCLQRSFAT